MAMLIRLCLILMLTTSACTEIIYEPVCRVVVGTDTTYVPYDPETCTLDADTTNA